MRRVPYIYIKGKSKEVVYICPKCFCEIQRDLYILQDYCPTCGHPINRTSLSIMKVYKLIDKDMLRHFIDK